MKILINNEYVNTDYIVRISKIIDSDGTSTKHLYFNIHFSDGAENKMCCGISYDDSNKVGILQNFTIFRDRLITSCLNNNISLVDMKSYNSNDIYVTPPVVTPVTEVSDIPEFTGH